MAAYYPQEANLFSKRAIVFIVIVVLHIFIIYAFATGLAKSGQRYLQTILQTTVIQQDKPKDLPPPPPPVDLKERPPVQVIAPDINITVPVETPPPIAIVTTKPTPPPPAPRAIVPGTQLSLTSKPDVADYYPEQARREGQEGRPQIKVCVGANGKIVSAEVATSSGFPLLDEAGVKVAKASRYKAATSEGKPMESCATLPVKFELHGG
ncbi:MAG TPA: energy transducer TonB [Steroidobacteraceae bacterium]|jgi:protein TonB|nr:energy transducer TonB [Steroidobacteraceae bacterium]